MYPSDEISHIQVANKQNMEIVGIINTTVQVQGHNLKVKFHVVDNLHTDFILGVDTLKNWSALVDFQQNCLRINGGKRSLVCDISTTIPPNSEKIVVARIKGISLPEGTTGISRPLLRHGQLLAANVMANVCDGKIYQRLINLSDNEVKIPRNTRLGEFTALSANDVLISMDEPDSPDSGNNKPFSSGTSKATIAAATINNSTSKISDQVHIRHDVHTPDQVKVVQQLVDEFSDIFRPHLGKCSIVEHRIDLLPDQRPFRQKLYKLPMQQQGIIDKIISNLLLLSYARSILYAEHLYPIPIPLRYNPFTIVLYNRLNAYPFRAAHTPAC